MFKKITFVLVIALLLPFCIVEAQEGKKINPDKISLNVLAGISTFSLNGDFKVFESPFAAGIQYTSSQNRVDAGLYLSPVVDEGKESKSSLAIMPFVNIYKQFGFGIGYKFWMAGQGIAKPEKHNMFLSFNFSLLQ